MALSVASFTANANWFSALLGGKSVTVSWSAGDAIIVFGAMETDVRDFVAPTATGLTFTQYSLQGGASTSNASAGLWGAIAGSSGTNVTVTLDSNGATQGGLAVWVITGGPSSIVGTTGNQTESAFSATTTAGDVVIYGLADWNATNPPGKTPLTGSGTATERFDTGNGSTYAVWGAEWVGTAAGTFSFGPNNYTSLQVGHVLLRVLGPSGTNAPAGSGPVSTTAQAATGQVLPAAAGSAVAVAAGAAVGRVHPAAGVGPVAVAASSAATQISVTATSAPVAVAAPQPVAAVRPNTTAAAVAVAASPAATVVRPASTAAPVAVAAPAPAVTVLAQAGAAAVAAVASDATVSTSTTTNANAGGAAVGVTANSAVANIPTLRVLQTYALSAADPHSITIPGATAGRDLWLIVNTAAVVTTPSGWTDEADRVATMASYIYRLDGASNTGGSIGVTLDLSAARALSAVAIEAKTIAAGTLYASLIAPVNFGTTDWGTGAHTFTTRDDVLAIYCLHTANATPATFTATAYDQGFTPLADTGWAGSGGSGDEAARVLVGFGVEQAFTAGGVVVTLSASQTTGSAVGFLAFDESTGTIATPANVAVTAGAATATVRGPAASGPVTVAAPAPLATVAPQAGQGAVTLTGQPATTTVRAQAGVAAVTAQGQAATVNTSSSTNANAGVAAVGVTASAAAAQVRPTATSAPVGAAGLFTTGSEIVLQLVMDNPVAITVTASNATVSTAAATNANAGGAPVTVTAPTPTVTVRALAGVAAVAAQGQAAAVQVTGQTLAQAGVAAVGVTASAPRSTVRPAAGASSVITSAAGPLAQIGARPGGAAVLVAALLMLAQARARPASAPVAVAGRNPVMGGAGAAWWIWQGGTLVRYRALLDGTHPATATIT